MKRIYRLQEAAKLIGVAPITVHRWATDSKYAHLDFPKPIPLGEGSVGYSEEEANDWLAKQAAKREMA